MTEGPDPIAVIGAACRFPASEHIDAFWTLLLQGRDAVTQLSVERLMAAGVAAEDLSDPDYVRAALLTPGVDTFDAEFFGMSASEADACDPQLRMFVEAAHSAVENAGYDITAIGDGTAVFAAAGPGRYRDIHLLADLSDTVEHARSEPDLAAFVSGRLDLRGPSVTLASCSLLAVVQAIRSLQAGDCAIALAGGAHLELPYSHGYRWVAGGRRPPDGHSRPFDVAAAGCVFGSGAGVVVLKRLSEAISDGDCVSAVIRAGVSGHPGTRDGGWATAVAEAMALAGCQPADLSYIEADGAAIGRADAHEVTALARGLRLGGGEVPPGGWLPIGCVKSNVGNLASAAGVAGLLKVVLALRREILPATLNVSRAHPGLNLNATPFRLAQDPCPWPLAEEAARRAAVHAVGSGGANSVLIVEEGTRPVPVAPDGRPRIVVWSGLRPESADAARATLAGFFATCAESDFEDIAATLRRGRTAHPVRRAVVCASAAEAASALLSPDAITADQAVTGPVDVAFSFPDLRAGQMLPTCMYGVHPAFTAAADLCLEAFERHGIELYDRWVAGSADGDVAGPLLFIAEQALAAIWQSWGVHPVAIIGAGVGEVAAATVAGALDLGDAVALLARTHQAAEPVWSASRIPVWSARDGRVLTGTTWSGPGKSTTDGYQRALQGVLAAGRRVLLEVAAGPGVDERHLLTALSRLWVLGVPVDWDHMDRDLPLQRLPAPGYPYLRQRHWIVPDRGPAAPTQLAEPRQSEQRARTVKASVEGLPIPAVPLRPLGSTEHAFWVLDQLAPASGVSNIGIALRTAKPLRWWPLQTAVNHLLRRHPALRLRFPEVDGVPVRHLTAGRDAELSIQTRPTTAENLVSDLQAFLHEPFDLRSDLPFRMGHFTLPDGGSVIPLAAHHIVIDAPSLQILAEEFGEIYDGITASGRIPDGLADEAPLLDEPQPAPAAIRYWLDHLRGAQPEAMVLPGSRPTPLRPTFAGHTRSWSMAEGALRAMRALRHELRTTDNVVLMSAFCLTLLRHGAGPDLVIGVPVGTRGPATAKHVGYGVSTMPLRIRVDPGAGFRDLVYGVGDAFLAGVEHASVSVERVITERGHGTGDWRVPLFRHMFNYRPWSDEKIRICGEVPDYVDDLPDRSRLDIQFIAVPEPDRFTLRCWYSTEVHDESEMEAFVARMQALLEQAAADPGRPVAHLPFGSAADGALRERLNRTARRWGAPRTVPERIAARAHLAPAAVSIVDGEQAVSLRQLVAWAAAVRDLLRQHGVRPGDAVALALGRSAAMAAAVLGVWAARTHYVPLDPDQPPARLAYQVENARARLVLTSGDTTVDWSPVAAVRMSATEDGERGPLLDAGAPDPDSAAYVIYTSGSTGRPKGVAVTHRNLLNLVCDFTDRLPPDAARAVLWSTAATFDISALELLLPLQTGGCVVVAPDGAPLKPRTFLDLIRRHDVSMAQATPTAWRLIVPETAGELAGRTLLCGGEPMPATLARQLRAHGGRVLNVYGPTETTIWSTAAELDQDPGDPVPIGRPISNTRVFIVDARGQELPPGVPGELCIAGEGVSGGYPGDPDLTAERFGEHRRYGRFYHTGDVARLRFDGVLELFGRTDRQVKLRGHRIELGEVEAVLHEHPAVVAAAVALLGDPQASGRLVAFVQPRANDGGALRLREELWRYARGRLPDHAVPSGITLVDRLPTTPNGKIDYRALRAVDVDGAPPEPAAGGALAPSDPELVAKLTLLWREALRRPGLGEHDNFFLNGGHSILAARLSGRIEEITGRPAPVRLVFDHPTPADLAAHLSHSNRGAG